MWTLRHVCAVAAALLLYVSDADATRTGSGYYQYADGVWTPRGIPVETQLWGNVAKPLERMVDVVNEFGLKVLAEHNFLNDNNIAFSPYGLTGIMVALYEGVAGESSYEIQRSMRLPWERKIMRIGFRDIHRTLKTYFVPESGFLAGLALSNENVTFRDSYKDVLRFYGFDLSNDQLPTLPPKNDTKAKDDEHTSSDQTTTTTEKITDTTEGINKKEETSSVTSSPEDKISPETEETTTITTIGVDIRQPMTTPGPSSASNAESTTNTMQQQTESTTNSPDVTVLPTAETGNSLSSTSASAAETTSTSTDGLISTTTMEAQGTAVPDEPTVNNEVEIISQTTTGESASPDMVSSTVTMTENSNTENMNTFVTEVTAIESTMSTNSPITVEPMLTREQMTTLTEVTPTTNESALETLERKKKSIVDFIYTNPSYVEDDYGYYGTFNLEPDYAEQYRNDFFLANGLRSVQVTFMYYETILDHAFLPHLQASALRLPLDSPRYYLLVVLPKHSGNRDVSLLLARLARESNLRDVHGALRPRHVRAVVPSFTVKGHVSLTTDLQKLGIRNVFEPRQRDFDPMTDQVGVYVRSVEQAVSVTIRKYQARAYYQNKKYAAGGPPVMFAATYPFVYFVMDSNIHVALMAGKVVDPLNNRIL